MIGKSLILAFRSFKKHKGYSFINLSGLALGIACCLLIILYIRFELSFDRYHDKADRIFCLGVDGRVGGSEFTWPESNAVTAREMKENYPEVEEAVRFGGMDSSVVSYKERIFYEKNLQYADHGVFKIFSWPLISGDPDTVLKDPFTIVITESLSKKYFENENPLGKVLKFNNRENFTVTGVMKDIPENSHFIFDGLCSFETHYSRGERPVAEFTGWLDFNFTTFVLIKEGFDHRELEKKFPEMLEEHAGRLMSLMGGEYRFFLIPLTDLYLRPVGESGLKPIYYVYIFSAVALFVLLIACVNFMNLTTARSAKRALEVGIRKVMGAEQGRLIGQFLAEAGFMSLLALFLSIPMVELALPIVGSLSGRTLQLNFYQMPWLIPGLLGLTLLTALVAGSYPAFFLASFQPIKVLKGHLRAGASNSLFRRILVVFQFTVSITLIIGTTLIMLQLNYLRNKDLGFNKEQVVVVPLNDERIRKTIPVLKEDLRSHAAVINAAVCSMIPGWSPPSNSKLPEGFQISQTQTMDEINADEGFIPTLELEITAGRNFSIEFGSDERNSVLINESAAKRFDWENPVGKTFRTYDPRLRKVLTKSVIGVVKDFHLRPLSSAIRPLYIGFDPEHPSPWAAMDLMLIRIKPGDVNNTIKLLEEKWQGLFPYAPFDYFFLDWSFNRQFSGVERSRKIFSYFTFLAIFIACLGLFGMAAFAAEQRTKEIGIRKVLGSSASRIIMLLSRELIILISLANLIAWPLAYALMKTWLRNFPYKAGISPFAFIISAGLIIVIGFATVAFQAVKAALADPVKSLRYE